MFSDFFNTNTYGSELRTYILKEDIFLYAPIVTVLFTLLMFGLIIFFSFFKQVPDKRKRLTAYSIYSTIGIGLTVLFLSLNMGTYSDIFSNDVKKKEITIVEMVHDTSKVRKNNEARYKKKKYRFIIKDENKEKYVFLGGVDGKVFGLELEEGQKVKITYYPYTKVIKNAEFIREN